MSRPSATLALAGLCGLTVHTTLLLTALTTVGIPRYVLGLWVPIGLGTLLSLVWLGDLCVKRRHEALSRPGVADA